MSTENKEVPKTGHIYDGIEELDHAPPTWFQALFLGTVVFGVGYLLYYTIGGGPTLVQEFQKYQIAAEIERYDYAAKNVVAKPMTEPELKTLVTDSEAVARGQKAFQSKCASCHGDQGQGGIGPNLADAYWIHGGKLVEIAKTITDGVSDKGMPPWGPVVGIPEIQALTAFIKTLEGKTAPNAKGPQGILVKKE